MGIVLSAYKFMNRIILISFQFDLQVEGTDIDFGNSTRGSVLCIKPFTQTIEKYVI